MALSTDGEARARGSLVARLGSELGEESGEGQVLGGRQVFVQKHSLYG